ncbi:uncharacterized protein LOC134660212 [Cydia amplana]|uniref:uncharacterized protein LOC134660212 n=1 Tax=Cydia amplana TaxID=1869771 RepID=UPI002FE61411
MEVLFGGALLRSKSSNRAVPSATAKTRNLSTGDVGHKMENVKRRGVYVEKWVNPKLPAEDNKRHKSKAQPIPRPQTPKLLTSAPRASNISTYTRLLGTADPAVRFIKRKKRTLPEKLPKQTSKTSKHEVKPRDIVTENKNINKFKSNVKLHHAKVSENERKKDLQTPSTSSKMGYDTNWSAIFPNRENSDNTTLLQHYICNYDSKPKDDKLKTVEGKDEQMYTFFKDLIETVYDEEMATNPDVQSRQSSDIKFEIDDPVAQKLQEYNSKQYTIEDQDFVYDQSRELADYYNNKSRLAPQKNVKLRKKNIKKITDKSVYSKENRSKKPTLLTLLKQQLAMDLNKQEEPESMYDALRNIAKNKRKRKQICFETPKEPSDLERVCRFKRRNVLIPTKKTPKRVRQTRCDSKTAEVKRTESTSTEFDSSHSLEVLGFDYDLEPDTVTSEVGTAISIIRSITNLNEGIMTITHHWKR